MLLSRQWVAVLVIASTACLAAAACSETARFRVLSFFLDGVPPPGAAQQLLSTTQEPGTVAIAPVTAPEPTIKRYYAHTPFRENRCGGCHDFDTGQLIRPVNEGLCLTCHAELTAGKRYVHGPVAVDDCTTCHHHHTAPFPNLLLTAPGPLCLECHDRTDLSAGDHHAESDAPECTSCHNPHGGADRFFLREGAS